MGSINRICNLAEGSRRYNKYKGVKSYDAVLNGTYICLKLGKKPWFIEISRTCTTR